MIALLGVSQLYVLAIIGFIIGLIFLNFYQNYNKGAQGEAITRQALQKLSDSYSLINDVNLSGGYGNIDHIILGSNGIFVIETKNYEGNIRCEGDVWYNYNEAWKGQKEYVIKSPSKQVKRNALKLKQFIESENILNKSLRLWVDSIVVFSHDNVNISCKNSTTPILKVNQLCDYIKNKKSNIQFSPQELEKIANLLLRKTGH